MTTGSLSLSLAALAAALAGSAGAAQPLTVVAADPDNGRAVFIDRDRGHCLLCHRVASLDEPFQGNLGPDLSTIGARARAGELRLRIVDPAALNPSTLMPPYHRVDGLHRVGEAYRGRPILTAQEVEDVIAYLLTLSGADA